MGGLGVWPVGVASYTDRGLFAHTEFDGEILSVTMLVFSWCFESFAVLFGVSLAAVVLPIGALALDEPERFALEESSFTSGFAELLFPEFSRRGKLAFSPSSLFTTLAVEFSVDSSWIGLPSQEDISSGDATDDTGDDTSAT